MKLFFTTLSFFAFITILPAQWYFSSLELTPADSVRFDSLIREVHYRLNTEQYWPLSAEEAMAKSVEEVRQIIPPDKLDKFETLLHTDIRTIDTAGFYGLGLSDGQSDSLSEFQERQRLRYDNRSVAEEQMEYEAYEYSLLTPAQKMQYSAYQKWMKKLDVSGVKLHVNQVAPGFEMSDLEATTLKTMLDQETREYLSNIEAEAEEQRFGFYKSKLKLIISREKLKQFDRAFEHRESIKHSMALQKDSIAFAVKYQQLTEFCKWWSENLEAEYRHLQKQYKAVISTVPMQEMDSIRKLEEEHFIAILNNADIQNKEQNPLYFEFTLLKKKQLQHYPNLRQTIDPVGSNQYFYFGFDPNFIKYRKEIIASIDPEVYKTLSVELLRLEMMMQHFMQQSAPDLFPEWFPDTPASVAAQNRILNFLLSMPDK